MSPYIEAMKHKIRQIYNEIHARWPDVTLRVGFVFYRDYDDDKPLECMNFTNYEDAAKL